MLVQDYFKTNSYNILHCTCIGVVILVIDDDDFDEEDLRSSLSRSR